MDVALNDWTNAKSVCVYVCARWKEREGKRQQRLKDNLGLWGVKTKRGKSKRAIERSQSTKEKRTTSTAPGVEFSLSKGTLSILLLQKEKKKNKKKEETGSDGILIRWKQEGGKWEYHRQKDRRKINEAFLRGANLISDFLSRFFLCAERFLLWDFLHNLYNGKQVYWKKQDEAKVCTERERGKLRVRESLPRKLTARMHEMVERRQTMRNGRERGNESLKRGLGWNEMEGDSRAERANHFGFLCVLANGTNALCVRELKDVYRQTRPPLLQRFDMQCCLSKCSSQSFWKYVADAVLCPVSLRNLVSTAVFSQSMHLGMEKMDDICVSQSLHSIRLCLICRDTSSLARSKKRGGRKTRFRELWGERRQNWVQIFLCQCFCLFRSLSYSTFALPSFTICILCISHFKYCKKISIQSRVFFVKRFIAMIDAAQAIFTWYP